MKHCLTLLLVLISCSVSAQSDSTLPYKRFPGVPPIQILLSDSATLYTKAQIPEKKPVLLMVFSPECSHCQHETEQLIAHKDELKDVHIVMVTMHPLWMMKNFVQEYKLNELPNVVVGRDVYYILAPFYQFHNLPFLAMYNKSGNLISTFEGSLGIPEVIEIFKQNQ